jgi:hypothetical protein
MDEGFWTPDEKVTSSEREELEAHFMIEEVKAAVFNSYLEGSLAHMVSFSYFLKSFGTS